MATECDAFDYSLSRWNIVTHAAIDGHSRVIVFIQASDNNRASTVLDAFVNASQIYGVPSRVRTDHGGENRDVVLLMEAHRGANRGSAIQGRSVHNQRIERLWRDVWQSVTNVYYDLFSCMETEEDAGGYGVLDITNDNHLWALHYIFLPKINAALKEFQFQWNNHGVRTERHQTPHQMFVRESLSRCNTTLTGMQDIFNGRRFDSISVGDLPDIPDISRVQVPAVPCPLTVQRFQHLQNLIDPLHDDEALGINMYKQVLEFLEEQNP